MTMTRQEEKVLKTLEISSASMREYIRSLSLMRDMISATIFKMGELGEALRNLSEEMENSSLSPNEIYDEDGWPEEADDDIRA